MLFSDFKGLKEVLDLQELLFKVLKLKGIKYRMQMNLSFFCSQILKQHWSMLFILEAVLTGSLRFSRFWPPLYWFCHTTLNLLLPKTTFYCYSVIKLIDVCKGVILSTMKSVPKYCYLTKGSFSDYCVEKLVLNLWLSALKIL